MKFQLQQKGLFTFYKEQQQFQEEIAQIKRKQNQKAETERKMETHSKIKEEDQTKSTSKSKKQSTLVIKHEKTNQMQKAQSAIKFKKFGEAVMIINRKDTQLPQHNPIKYQSGGMSTSKDQGYFIENKNIEFDSPIREVFRQNRERQALNRRKLLFAKKRQDSVFSNNRYEKQQERSSRLPTLARVETTKNSLNPDMNRNKINGSLLRSNGNDLLRQIRNNALNECHTKKEQIKRSVSYIEYNNDYCYDGELRKKEKLSPQQRKLLQILSQYKRSDF